MGFWSTILKYGGKAAKSTGKSVGEAVLHPTTTLRNAGKAVKTAAVGGAAGYVGWEKLTTDKSIARIVSDAVVGERGTERLSEVGESVKAVTSKAGETMSAVSGGINNATSSLGGISNAIGELTNGGGKDMFKNFFNNLTGGNVSGLGIAGLLAASYLVFGRGGLLRKVAGTLLALMLIGNNANLGVQQSNGRAEAPNQNIQEEESQSRGLRR